MSSNGGNRSNSIMTHAEDDEEASRMARQLASSSVLPMVLRAAIELNLLELIKKAGPEATASASELASQLPTKNNPGAINMIDRILRFLAAHSVLTCTVGPLQEGPAGLERRYGLSPACRFLTKNEDGVSLATCFSLLHNDKVSMEMWYHLKDAVLDGGIPFDRAHGMSVYEYAAVDPRFNELFNRAMSESSIIFMKKILETYKGFEGLKSLAVVGGGIGTSLEMILSKYPYIKGVNFDLPHVIQNATSYPGIEHVGGDMFVSVPKAEAIFMKRICHDWSDEQCKKLLKNCYEALREGGKVIVAETMIPEDADSGPGYTWAAQFDMLMMSFTSGGRGRTEKEFRALAEYAGFKQAIKVCCPFQIWIMEFHK